MKKITKIPNVDIVDWAVPYPTLNITFKDKLFSTDYDGVIFTVKTFKKMLERVVLEVAAYDGATFGITVNNRHYSSDDFTAMYSSIIKYLTEKYIDRKKTITLQTSQIEALINHSIATSTDVSYKSAIKELKRYLK